MAPGPDPLQFVLSSSVRSDLLRAIAEGTRTTDDLLASIDASSSAIYSALGRLEESSLVSSDDDEAWSLTGSGRLVADFVRRRDRLERVLAEAESYLAAHDLSAIPPAYRLRMSELAGAEVLEASETEPQRVVRELTERFETAERADVMSPIYAEALGSAMPTTDDSRLLLDVGVVETAVEAVDGEAALERELDDWTDTNVRVDHVEFALAVTDDALLLSLPDLDGSYDARTEFVAETERGRQWGIDLFEDYWADAESLGPYVRERYL